MPVSVTYRREAFEVRIAERAGQALQVAGLVLQRECMLAVGVANTGVSKVRTRDTSRGKAGSQYTVYPNPSKPGQPPRLRSGFGRSNIFLRSVGSKRKPVVQVGVGGNAAYMFLLEVGTKRVARRPWLLATLQKSKGKMDAAIKKVVALP